MKIEDFHALLTSEGKENALLTALRELTKIVKVEEVVVPIDVNAPSWF
jgi:hypothetical protein